MNQPDNTTKQSVSTRIALRVLGTAVALALGEYSGLYFFLPLSATALAWWFARKFFSQAKRSVIPAFAVQAGGLLWLGFGIAFTGVFTSTTFDFVLLLVGLLWLVQKPSQGPIYLLGAYQAFGLVVDAMAFTHAVVGTASHKTLIVDLIGVFYPLPCWASCSSKYAVHRRVD